MEDQFCITCLVLDALLLALHCATVVVGGVGYEFNYNISLTVPGHPAPTTEVGE